MTLPPLAILGSAGHGTVVADIVRAEARFQLVGWIHSFAQPGTEFGGLAVLGGETSVAQLFEDAKLSALLIAVGDNWQRARLRQSIEASAPDIRWCTAIHPRATVAPSASIGQGSVIMAGAVVNPGCQIGEFCIVNTNSSLDHDSVMDDYSSLGPRVATGGNVTIGAYSAICLGANIVHRVSIGAHTVVGAGATVLDNLPGLVTAWGTPARVTGSRNREDSYL